MIQDARDFNWIDQTMLDARPELFNCKNCVLNLDTHEILTHDPDLLLSKVANVNYDEDAHCDLFNGFMREIMLNDEEKIRYIRDILGYALTGTNTQEECYMFYGSTTRNGKSTLLDTISYLFGDYSMNIQPETLAQQKERNSRSASGDIARLDGCRLLHMSEPPKRMKFDVALLKTLLGRDKITARNLYEREFEFVPVFKLFINTNFLPVVTDDTLFSSGRVKVVTFDKHFSQEEQDKTLKEKLKAENELSGVLNWLLEGLEEYQSNNRTLTVPKAVKDATEDYRTRSDKIQNFMNDCLVHKEKGVVTAKAVYEVYVEWCRDNGFGTENKSNFLDELRTKGLLHETGTIDGKTVHNVLKGY